MSDIAAESSESRALGRRRVGTHLTATELYGYGTATLSEPSRF